jgi:hypothetical protein
VLLGLLVSALAGCSRSSTVPDDEAAPEPVVVYSARLMSEHPLYPEAQRLTARIGELSAPADVRAQRALLAEPLRERLLGPPPVAPVSLGAFGDWEAAADRELAQSLRDVEQTLAAWPATEAAKTQPRLERQAAEAVRQAESKAAAAREQAEWRAIDRHRAELQRLFVQAQSADRGEARKAVERQARIWREIAVEVEAARREAEADLQALRAEGARAMAAAVEEAARRTSEEQASHLADLERAREPLAGLAEAVGRAVQPVEPAANAREVPPAPDTDDLGALLGRIEAAQREARKRQMNRLIAARDRLLRDIALNAQAAVQATAIRTGADVRFAPEADAELRDATEEFRPLLRDYWAARP